MMKILFFRKDWLQTRRWKLLRCWLNLRNLFLTCFIVKLKAGKDVCWKDQWWIPLTWAISLINANHGKSQGCEVKDQKDFISQINRFQLKLHNLVTYQNNPLPLIYGQALMIAIFSWILLGAFAKQYLDIQHSASIIVFGFPFYQVHFAVFP